MAAALNTFAAIKSNGEYQCQENEQDGSMMLSLNFSTIDGENKCIEGKDLLDFVRHLGFIRHDDDKMEDELALFIDEYSIIVKVQENISSINMLGGELNLSTYFPHKGVLVIINET